MKKARTIFLVLSCLLPAGCRPENSENLVIAAAANTRFAMEELVAAFSRETGIMCETIFASSGKLTVQIRQGAPFDVFIAADMNYPEKLFREGFSKKPPRLYAYGKLVLWSSDTSRLLAGKNVNHIALANPRTAPYGQAAVEALKSFALYKAVESKLVYGESISEVNHFIISGTAEMGFTSLSSVMAGEMKGKGQWILIDTASYSRLTQGAVLLKRSKRRPQAQRFYDFLLSHKGKQILREFGYKVNQND
ncbi:molybdate transport system substrate-binding protein [Anseongella ginsenosidimutans]|uniref:Molybdate transport system substrate-binding protein n=1 Tax=Anseongella ginsenosidimutans TaxID=496056 RepID=A0A4R3KR09_9SPHI|nr:molybdate ABC transporter substrate-binding protein [Anseongella ginsenosidimutans]QEC52241.1 molybdate ABC transporter substrate-binding protein [Anseongella ginsenosidimutans]TCS86793.1 molybdate transport system substrate-binding protein [Anseongella ginsenosidimutans]